MSLVSACLKAATSSTQGLPVDGENDATPGDVLTTGIDGGAPDVSE
jgi:hypothetical protein